MENIRLSISRAFVEVSGDLRREAEAANALLESGRGAGNDFLGWVNLPARTTPEELAAIEQAAAALRSQADVIVVVGIGGSYLGARAVQEALSDSFACLRRNPQGARVVFAGQNLSEDYLHELLDALQQWSVAAIVISKSGTTTEPAVAFRLLRDAIERRYGKQEASRRIVAVTDRSRGALRTLAESQGYTTFVIPDNVGGRYSVLTPVGLLPLGAAGIDIGELIRGAQDMQRVTAASVPYADNPAVQYAAVRNTLYRAGYKIELLASYEPKLQYIAEWWKQLYGESEGKDGKGIFPASVTYTADLHSMGQYIQDGERFLFETVLSVAQPARELRIPGDDADLDGLGFLAGRRLGKVNRMAELGVSLAHADGGVPNLRIELPAVTPYWIGALLYFFERACGISGYLLGVNPFDQPGVEAYKRNMFALLDKPGYEAEGDALRARLKEND